MPIDSSIAMGIRPVQIDSPLNALAQVLQAKGLQNQNDLAQYTLGKAKRTDDDMNALMVHLQNGGDLSTDAGQRAAMNAAPLSAPGFIKTRLDQQKTVADTAHANASATKEMSEATEKRLSQWRDLSQQITTPESAAAFLQAMRSDPTMRDTPIAQVPLDQALSQIPKDPAQLETWKQKFAVGATKFIELNKPNIQTRNTGGSTDTISVPGLGGAATVISSVQNTVSPDASLQASTSRSNTAANIAKDFKLAGVNPDGSPSDGGGLLSPESVINAATRYNMDGTLPPNLGRGTQGPRQTAQILNEAARQAAARGDTPEAQRIAQLANKSSAAALTKLSTQEAAVGAFEKNFTKNADIAEELSAKVDRTGVPLLNKWINAGKRSVQGDPELSAFDASVKATVNEYAKIVGGGSGGAATAQGEISKIEGLLSAAQTKEQVSSVLSLMRRETANRMQSFQEQKAELKSGMVVPGSVKPAPHAPVPPAAPAGWKIEKVN